MTPPCSALHTASKELIPTGLILATGLVLMLKVCVNFGLSDFVIGLKSCAQHTQDEHLKDS